MLTPTSFWYGNRSKSLDSKLLLNPHFFPIGDNTMGPNWCGSPAKMIWPQSLSINEIGMTISGSVHWPASSMIAWVKWPVLNFMNNKLPKVLHVLIKMRCIAMNSELHWTRIPFSNGFSGSVVDLGDAIDTVIQCGSNSSGICSRWILFWPTIRANSPAVKTPLSANSFVIKFAALFDGAATIKRLFPFLYNCRMISTNVDVLPVPWQTEKDIV